MSKWEKVPAGIVASQRKDIVTLEPGVEYQTMGVRWYGRGAYDRGIGTTETIKAKRLFRAHKGDFVFNRIDTQNGAFDVVPPALDGALATNEFPLYVVDPDQLSERFLLLYFQQSSVLAQIDAMRAGSEGRSRWKEADFEAWRIPLPSPAEQRRIVDVIATVDAQIETLSAELSTSQAALGPLISDLLSQGGASWPLKRLDQIGTFTRGRRFTKADYVESGLSAIHYGQIHTDLGLITTEALTYLPDYFQDRMRLASRGDVVIAATSENVADLGNATVWLGDGVAAVHDDANIFKHDLDPVFAGCLFFSPAFQQQKVQYAAGTKVTRISSSNLGKIEVPIPTDRGDQARIGGAVRAFSRAIDARRADLGHLRTFRSSLLTSLLNQGIEIPSSYDLLLGEEL